LHFSYPLELTIKPNHPLLGGSAYTVNLYPYPPRPLVTGRGKPVAQNPTCREPPPLPVESPCRRVESSSCTCSLCSKPVTACSAALEFSTDSKGVLGVSMGISMGALETRHGQMLHLLHEAAAAGGCGGRRCTARRWAAGVPGGVHRLREVAVGMRHRACGFQRYSQTKPT
jgi:hypothetical protein